LCWSGRTQARPALGRPAPMPREARLANRSVGGRRW
jgi:hypothetical protein